MRRPRAATVRRAHLQVHCTAAPLLVLLGALYGAAAASTRGAAHASAPHGANHGAIHFERAAPGRAAAAIIVGALVWPGNPTKRVHAARGARAPL